MRQHGNYQIRCLQQFGGGLPKHTPAFAFIARQIAPVLFAQLLTRRLNFLRQ